ncbi:MAG: hypothetical protein EX268_12785 [Deltaproteobacteria bacterium]|nr:MAG: hypothetical protein EX268_12785 [Deltaproteobacteria bacterium]
MPSSPPFDARQALRFATGALAGRISIPLSAIRGRLGAISEKVSLTVDGRKDPTVVGGGAGLRDTRATLAMKAHCARSRSTMGRTPLHPTLEALR